jgi:FkbM family methyltransferase
VGLACTGPDVAAGRAAWNKAIMICAFVAPDGSSYKLVVPDSDSSYYRLVRETGAFDGGVPRLVWGMVGPGDVLLDLGANLGVLSVPSAVKGVRVFAFEALPENAVLLEQARMENGVDNLTVVPRAVWSHKETLRVGGYEAWGQVNPSGHLTVESISLDEFVKETGIEQIHVVKIDIEGAELPALRGMTHILKDMQPDLVVEANVLTCGAAGYSIHDVFDRISSFGYSLFRIAGLSLMPFETNGLQETPCCDYLATCKPASLPQRIAPFQVEAVGPSFFIALMKTLASNGPDHRGYMALQRSDLPAEYWADPELASLMKLWASEPIETRISDALVAGSRKVARKTEERLLTRLLQLPGALSARLRRSISSSRSSAG